MKQIFLLIFCISLTFLLQAQISKTVNVTAGGLSASLTATEKSTVTNLTVTGTIDGTDFETMYNEMPVLSMLDLSAVTVTNPLNAIPESAFEDNSNLTSIIVPTSVSIIGENAFYECSVLTAVVIPEGVTSIPKGAFENCTSLKSINIPSSVSKIGEYAFEYCSSLKSIILPSTLTTIEDESFKNCTSLTSITIPSSVTYLGDEIFSGCDSLATVIISEGVTNIGRWMFNNCSGLTSVTFPSSIISIGEYAFAGDTVLNSIYAYQSTPVELKNSVGVFYALNKTTCILNVPKGSKIAYQNADQWKDFLNIVEMDNPNVINERSITSEAKIYTSAQLIYVRFPETPKNTRINIYDINGSLIISKIADDILTTIQISRNGVYAVKVVDEYNKKIEKVVISCYN